MTLDRRARQARRVALGEKGELWALTKLQKLGLNAYRTSRNAKNVDIVISDGAGGRVRDLQVKSRDRYKNWTMSRRHETIIDPLLYYCFLEFDAADLSREPVSWIVPSEVVANALRESHQAYLSQSPGTRKDTAKRNFRGDYTNRGLIEKYGPGWLDEYRDALNSFLT